MDPEIKNDFKNFIQRIYINGHKSQVFEMITKVELITKWYVKSAVYHSQSGELRKREGNVAANDEYSWEWVDGSILNGIIIEVKEGESLKFTFGDDVTVNISFKQKGDRTLVELIQEQNMEDYETRYENYLNCFPGWAFYLTNLKSVYEGGIDLREHNPDLESLVNI